MTIKMSMLAIATLAAPVAAHAATPPATKTIIQTVAFGGSGSGGFVFGNQGTGSAVALFNSQLGELTSVAVTAGFSFSSSITTINYGTSAVSGQIGAKAFGSYGALILSINSVIASDLNTLSNSVYASPALVAFNAVGPANQVTVPAQSYGSITVSGGTSPSRTVVDTTAADLAAFTTIGSSNFMPTFAGGSTTYSPSVSSVAGAANTAFIPSLTFTYTYIASAVPEASIWAMMVVGLGVVGGSLRRRRSVGTRFNFA